MKAVILARISSKEQQDGHSLDAQIRNLENYAKRKKLDVVRTFTLVESSTKKRRPEFDQMVRYIKRHKTKIALIVDTVDRLQRSFRETPIFNDLMEKEILELHFVKENNILSKDANSAQKLMWNMGVVMAQSYTDQLSDNVRRSMKHKVQNGEWCGLAPLGYTNVINNTTGKAFIIPDKDNADIIKRVFLEYATGAYSVSELSRKTKEWGLRSRKGYAIGSQLLLTMLQNPFYYGVMRVKGKMYTHKYEPIITKDTFDKCQQVQKKRAHNRSVTDTKYPYLYRGLIQCAVSDRQVTCDLKKKKYVYLICRDPDNPRKKLWVKESTVTEQLEEALESIRIPDEYLQPAIDHVRKSVKNQISQDQNKTLKLHQERVEIENKIDKLTDLLMNNSITQETYDRKHSALQQRHSDITVTLNEQTHDNNTLEKALITLLKLSNKAALVIKSSKTDLKRALLKTVFSNLLLNGCNVQYAMVRPLCNMLNKSELNEWLGWHHSN